MIESYVVPVCCNSSTAVSNWSTMGVERNSTYSSPTSFVDRPKIGSDRILCIGGICVPVSPYSVPEVTNWLRLENKKDCHEDRLTNRTPTGGPMMCKSTLITSTRCQWVSGVHSDPVVSSRLSRTAYGIPKGTPWRTAFRVYVGGRFFNCTFWYTVNLGWKEVRSHQVVRHNGRLRHLSHL